MKKIYKVTKVSNNSNYRRILNEIKKIDDVENYKLNKEQALLYIEFKDDVEDIESKLLKAFRKYEKDAILTEVISDTVYRKVLLLRGLDCGYCAQRVEDLAKKEFNHERIVVDFSTERFIIETKDKNLYENVIEEVTKVTHKIDPNVVVKEIDDRTHHDIEIKPIIKKHHLIMFIIGIVLALGFMVARTIITKGFGWLHDGTGNDKSSFAVIDYIVLFSSLFLVGYEVIIDFVHNIFKRRELDEKFLMVIASIGAVITGHTLEAIAVMAFYQVGELLQEYAVNHSRKSIKELLTFEVSTAHLKIDDSEMEVEVESILPNDILVVKTGEMIPVDGVIVSGKSYLDLKTLTGEVLSQNVKVGDNVRSGSINLGKVIEVKATKLYKDSTMSQILDMVENASATKAKSENFISRFAKLYTPIIVFIAVVVALIVPLFICLVNNDFTNFTSLLFGSDTDKGFIYKGMVFLVIGCPCALVISVPLAYFGGIGLASKRGILVKGSNYLEILEKTDNILFDKTGTLTKGEFSVKDIVPVIDTITKDELHKLMAYAEYHSTHPIGISITESYGRENIFPDIIDEFSHIPGVGVRAIINGNRIRVCNYKKLMDEKIDFKEIDSNYLVLYVVKEKQVIGYVEIGDTIKDEAKDTINKLRKDGIKRIALLTGDSIKTSSVIKEELALDEMYAGLLPNDKVETLNKIKEETEKGRKTIYVGDGINDAPVLSAADVGIAIGAHASEGSIAIADVVIMNDNLSKIDEAIQISHITKIIVYENIIMALFFKMIVAVITFFDVPSMIWFAIFSDVGVSLLAILNSLRIIVLFKRKDKINE